MKKENQDKPALSRAENRHELARAKARAERIAKLSLYWLFGESQEERKESIRRFTLAHYRNRKRCSCQMCRNRRHSSLFKGKERITMQERVAPKPQDEDNTQKCPKTAI